jgi:two-component system NtrC family sensor kinase
VKLAYKIMAAVMLVFAVLLAIHSYLVFQRELGLFRDDMELHAYLLGSVLASSVRDIWVANGPERVQSIIEDANRSEQLVQVRWVWFDVPPGNASAPRVKIEDLSGLRRGEELLFPEYRWEGSDYHISYFPVIVDGGRLSALELSEPLAPMRSYIWTTVVRKIVLFVAFLIIGGVFVWWLGIRLVGRPVHTMIDQARSVGEGDLTVRNDLGHASDEIGELAKGLNDMVEDLRLARARIEEETSKRLAAIEQLNHAERLATVGKLASGLAHELGTPLNVVAGRAKMIAGESMSTSEIADSATVIASQADRMTGIIRHLLDFARSRPPEKHSAKLSQPVNNVVKLLSPIATERSIELHVQASSDSPDVEVDVDQIQQVLSNLIVNAIHAMPDGGRITIQCGRRPVTPPADHGGNESDFAYIDVIDTGVGIPEENLSQVFTPFFSTKQVGEGTGLGLSIAHGIVQEHGGWLAAESKVGHGSKFSIYLPIGDDS